MANKQSVYTKSFGKDNFNLFATAKTATITSKAKKEKTTISFFGKKNKKVKKESSGNFREFIAKLSRGLMLPIAILPIAGLFMGIGAAIQGQGVEGSAAYIIGNIIFTPGNAIFAALPVLFCIAIAITFTKDAGAAALSALVGWIVFCAFQTSLIIKHTHIDADKKVILDSISFLWYHFSESAKVFKMGIFDNLFTMNVGIHSLSTSVFGGIIVGSMVAFLYNKFKDIQLPQLIGFFSGIRFVPIITFVSAILLSLIFSMIWPIIGMGLYWIGFGMTNAPGGISGLIYGTINRALVPFGLHHVLNAPLWFTDTGGTFETGKDAVVSYNGIAYYVFDANTPWSAKTTWSTLFGYGTSNTIFKGDINIFIEIMKHAGNKVNLHAVNGPAELTNVSLTYDMMFKGSGFNGTTLTNKFLYNPGQYTSGSYAITLLALPAAALAMIMAAPKGDGRKMALSICGSAGFVCLLTGITEPIEFTFLLLAPYLYWGFHAVMTGTAYMFSILLSLNTNFGPHIGFSFSSGLLDFTIYGVISDIRGGQANTFIPILMSLLYAPLYYFVFLIAIKKLNIKTPGREGSTNKLGSKAEFQSIRASKSSSVKVSKEEEGKALAIKVIAAYGGRSNIKNVDACITKLRIQVKDQSKVDKDELMRLGARGVMKPSPQSVYAVFGTKADYIKNQINKVFGNE